MVAVWRCGHLKSTCTHEFGSAQRSVDAIDAHWIRIEFPLGNSVTEPVWIQIQCGRTFSKHNAVSVFIIIIVTDTFQILTHCL